MSRPELQKHIDLLCTKFDFKQFERIEVYSHWLSQVFYQVSHSTRLISLTAARLHLNHDSIHRGMIERMREEVGHQMLAKRDLENLGYKLDDFPELEETKAFYGYQYYSIEHKSPTSFLGYVICLEALAILVGGKIKETVDKAFGSKVSSFLKVHVEEDIEHLEDAYKMYDQLSSQEKEAVIENLLVCCNMYEGFLDRLYALPSEMKTAA